MKKSMIFKIGGSVIYDKLLNINESLIAKVKSWYYDNLDQYDKIVMVVGGGTLSRDLQEKIAGSIGGKEYLHSIGMSVTNTNANLLRGYLDDPKIHVPVRLGEAYELLLEKERKTIVCGGLKVGWSTDMDAALFADILNEKKIYKISNIDYVYDKDPNLFEDAKPIEEMTWDEYFDLFNIDQNSTHLPNNNIPVDVECARFCSRKEISLLLSGGKRIDEVSTFEDVIKSGTLIKP